MNASLIIVTNPFEPVTSRSVHSVDAGMTVGTLLLDCGIAEESWATGPEIRIGTDMALPTDVYALRVIGDGDIVTVIRWPMGGGGGGGGGKNPLRTV